MFCFEHIKLKISRGQPARMKRQLDIGVKLRGKFWTGDTHLGVISVLMVFKETR